ncbi:hypothetical protein J8N05_18520 [Streptomyces sp. BH-SS-21]|uniref:Uncharacterized protein n=1 Tax=Streptomyces liliiviolaceus TaxID=2823109 RepID=A0A940Y3Z3_9ACTN|nr:hypothetical protein [Streptomyces liliiviolaceus]MBQ0850194.1 hypothetical protein [Streptomyces liliiviolaceus]
MASSRKPRLADAAEIAAEQGLTSARVTRLYNTRDSSGFPEIAGMRRRARLWDHAEVTRWFAQRSLARLGDHASPSRDADELLNGAAASKFLGYKNVNQVTTYVRDHPGYFPDPDVVEELGTPERPYRRLLWRVQTLLDWKAARPGSGRYVSSERPAKALPDVPADGDPDELLGATQAAALLGYKSVGSFSSSLAQGNLPLLETPDALSEKGGRRRWTRKRILTQAAQRRQKR